MYEIKVNINIEGKVYEAGDIIDTKVIPSKSIKWLTDQNIIVKVDKKYKEKKLHEIAMDMAMAEEE